MHAVVRHSAFDEIERHGGCVQYAAANLEDGHFTDAKVAQ